VLGVLLSDEWHHRQAVTHFLVACWTSNSYSWLRVTAKSIIISNVSGLFGTQTPNAHPWSSKVTVRCRPNYTVHARRWWPVRLPLPTVSIQPSLSSEGCRNCTRHTRYCMVCQILECMYTAAQGLLLIHSRAYTTLASGRGMMPPFVSLPRTSHKSLSPVHTRMYMPAIYRNQHSILL
jgi:hypothetical protein